MTIKINKQLILEGFEGIDIAQDLRLDNNDNTNDLQNGYLSAHDKHLGTHDKHLGTHDQQLDSFNKFMDTQIGINNDLADISTTHNKLFDYQRNLNGELAAVGAAGSGLGALGVGLGGAALYRTRNQNQVR